MSSMFEHCDCCLSIRCCFNFIKEKLESLSSVWPQWKCSLQAHWAPSHSNSSYRLPSTSPKRRGNTSEKSQRIFVISLSLPEGDKMWNVTCNEMSSAEWLAQGSRSMRAVLSAWKWQQLGQPLGNWLSLSCPQPSHHCIQKQACAQNQPWASSSSYLARKKNPIFSFFTNYVFPKYFFFLPAVSLCILFPLPHHCRSKNFHTSNEFLKERNWWEFLFLWQWFRSAVIKENAMPEGLMTLLFSNIDPIYEFHRGFLKEIEQRLSLW